MKAVKARDMVGIDGLLKKLNELKGRVASGSPASRPAASAPAAPASQNRVREAASEDGTAASSVEDAWAYAIEHLGKVTPLAKSYLVGTRPLGLRGNVLVVQFDPEFADRKEFADRPRNIEVLQAKLKEKLRMDVALKFEVGEAAPRPAAKAPAAPAAAKPLADKPAEPAKKNLDEFKNDPLIKKALEIFKGTIVEVRK